MGVRRGSHSSRLVTQQQLTHTWLPGLKAWGIRERLPTLQQLHPDPLLHKHASLSFSVPWDLLGDFFFSFLRSPAGSRSPNLNFFTLETQLLPRELPAEQKGNTGIGLGKVKEGLDPRILDPFWLMGFLLPTQPSPAPTPSRTPVRDPDRCTAWGVP